MSTQSSDNNKRIAKNTLLLYLRLTLTMGVGLFTSRVVKNTLGVEDYGVYNVVGGVVAMFALFTGSLSAAIRKVDWIGNMSVFSINESNESLLSNFREKKMYEIVNKHIKKLTTQYIGTCKSV